MNAAPVRALLRAPDDGRRARWWRFAAPVESLGAATLAEVSSLLERIEHATAQGLWAVGYVTYEAAPAFDPALVVRPAAKGLLAAFALFPPPAPGELGPDAGQPELAPLLPGRTEAEHAAAFAAILAAIAAGETYEVNFTFPLRTLFSGGPETLVRRLAPASAAPGPHCAKVQASAAASLVASRDVID